MNTVNPFLTAAAILAVVVGLAHTVLGEILIFRRLRERRVIPTIGGTRLEERHVRILWASWHTLTVFGWGMAGLLFWLARQPQLADFRVVSVAISVAMAGGSLLVLVGTKGRHPGWIGLGLVALLVWRGTL